MNFSREMMINDDLNVLTSVPRLMRASMERYKNYLAYQALVKAENYSNDKGNLGTAAALSVKSLGEAKKLMRKQKLGEKMVLKHRAEISDRSGGVGNYSRTAFDLYR